MMMDASQLAAMMLEWESKRRALDALESEIKAAVLDLGMTQTVGNVRAGYSAGRRTYDYEAAILEASPPAGALVPFTKTVIDYRAACKELKIENVPVASMSGPSVSIKLLD